MRQKTSYDREAVGGRLRCRRKQLGWTRKFVAERAELGEKYYSDIERGTCGMSIETLISLTKLFGYTMDELLYGEETGAPGLKKGELLLKNLECLPEEAQDCCLQMLFLFMKGLETGNHDGDNAAQEKQGSIR